MPKLAAAMIEEFQNEDPNVQDPGESDCGIPNQDQGNTIEHNIKTIKKTIIITFQADEEMSNDKNVSVNNQGSSKPQFNYNKRNQRYNAAYGNYRGGYGPGEGYGPFGPHGQMGPPPRGPPPPMGWFRDRNFAARRSTRALNYLKSCGVHKDHLKNLPRDLLEQIEPNYCGLCGHELDSDAISRMHYLSKNHLKKMKKWVSNKPDTFYDPNTKEIPFKSRDLYCELCDVHITSKVHAESHYTGKPHRAIVEGRKFPKNPFLLQSGMEKRLAQLIRREKKSLKYMDDAAKKLKEGEGTSETKDKPIPPELYCNICDASVTCTEQMTMHLNGKKHLTKEKQYILKMMKGDTIEKDKKDSTTTTNNLADEEDDDADEASDEKQNKPPISLDDDGESEWPIEGEKWDYM